MSIAAFISKEQNEFEKEFYIPIATEKFFKECWIPAIEATDSKWVACFQPGISISKEDLSFLLVELEKIEIWSNKNLLGENLEQMVSRIGLLQLKLPTAFQRNDAIVFIG